MGTLSSIPSEGASASSCFSHSGPSEIPNLDYLRSFAVLAVLINHWMMMDDRLHGRPWSIFGLTLGYIGVLAFFVHTSLVLMMSLDRMKRSDKWLALRFYVRRIFRIYPLAILTVVIVVISRVPQVPVFGNEFTDPGPRNLILNLGLLQNLFSESSVVSTLWSLPYEMNMYAVLPALYFVAIRKDAARLLGLVFVLSLAVAYWEGYTGLAYTGPWTFFAYVPCFLAGVISFVFIPQITARIPGVGWPLFLLVWFGVFCAITNDSRTSKRLILGGCMCLLLGLAIGFFEQSPVRLWNRTAYVVAKYSYGIYLAHFPLLWLVGPLWTHSRIFATGAWLALTALASVLSYHLVEAPMITVGKKLSDRLIVSTHIADKTPFAQTSAPALEPTSD